MVILRWCSCSGVDFPFSPRFEALKSSRAIGVVWEAETSGPRCWMTCRKICAFGGRFPSSIEVLDMRPGTTRGAVGEDVLEDARDSAALHRAAGGSWELREKTTFACEPRNKERSAFWLPCVQKMRKASGKPVAIRSLPAFGTGGGAGFPSHASDLQWACGNGVRIGKLGPAVLASKLCVLNAKRWFFWGRTAGY